MVYQKYGETFRRIRQQRGLSTSAFKYLGISKTTISNFENGKQMMAFDKVEAALREMHVTLSDYQLSINNGIIDHYIDAFSRIESAYFAQDERQLSFIYQDYKDSINEWDHKIALSAKACYRSLSDAEKAELMHYFDHLEEWNLFDLSVYANCITQLDNDYTFKLMEHFWNSRHSYMASSSYRRILTRAVCRVLINFVEADEKEMAEVILKRLKDALFPTDLVLRVFIKFFEGYYEYAFVNKSEGKKEMRKLIRICETLESYELENIFEHYYKRAVTKDKKA
ncbi:Rgg/GadR/MutR family transcriptional regulator [Lactococcus termiticola]|uniref:XRE family transcriptional regulator n=1 Tax=Lactococcus termiticola TaxID=2169526 RepID=A0A2R5HGV6_9LACT|nr:Rgg/GadR/MutR family transcriptional regulator [Lactococcus termiticola]GBG97269.1 XRE family transcriptional regulator [Lactococcus termiticola]